MKETTANDQSSIPVHCSFSGVATMPEQSRLFSTSDLECARREIEKIYTTYEYRSQARSKERKPVVMYNLPGNAISLSTFSYGAHIHVDPAPFEDFHLALTTVRGYSSIHTPSVHSQGGIGNTVLIVPDELSHYEYNQDNTQVAAKISNAKIDEVAIRLFQQSIKSLKVKSIALNDAHRNALWNNQISYLRQVLDPRMDTRTKNVLLPRAEEALIITLLCLQYDVESKSVPSLGHNPACLKRAIAFIQEFSDQPVTLSDIANAARCSIRSLNRVFSSSQDTTPIQYLRRVRLNNAHRLLQNPDAGDSVTGIALRCGFSHMGQFSADYKSAFGVAPSKTFKCSD